MISHFFFLALECGYPEELHYKLLERKGKILMFFKQFVDARNVFKELLKALDKAKVDSNKKIKIQKDAQVIFQLSISKFREMDFFKYIQGRHYGFTNF